MPTARDFKRVLQSKLDRKVDVTIPFRAVLCDSIGLTSGTGSVWANQNTRLVWYLPIGGGQPAMVRCMRLEPQLGLGVIIGYADGSVELEVLSDDPFLRNSNTTGRSYMTVTAADLQPGGRLQLWLYSKLFVPLAVYPGTGLSVSVAPGDYEGENGERRSFSGQNNFSIAAHQPAGPNQHRLVGISISTGGALVATAGTTVSTAVTAPEPAWPVNETRLAVVDLDDTQTTISFASDIFDRRLFFSFPGPLNNYTATVDPTPTDDTTDGYEPGSIWLNVTEHRAWINIISTTNAAVWRPFGNTPLATFFLHSEASDIATYLSLFEIPAEDPEEDDTAVVNSAGGEVLIKAFATEAGGLGLTLLPGGAWQFITYASVDSAVGVSSIVIRVYKYEVDTTETELFNVTTPEINGLVATEYETTTVQGDFALVATDRLVVKYYAQTTSVVNRTVHLYYEGTANYSHIHTPLSSSAAGTGWPFPNIITVSAAGDYTTLQDAIDSVAAGGTGVIYADRGTYTENLTISGKDITIKGQGNDPSLVMTYGTDPLVVIDGTVTLESDGTNNCLFTAIDCGFTATISGDNSVSGGGINLFVRGGYLYLPALSIDLAGTAYVTLLYSTVLHVSGPGNNAISINNTSGGTFTAVECNLGDITFVNANTTYYLTNTIYGTITSGTLGRSDLIGGLDVGDVSAVATGEALIWDGSKAVFKPGGGIVVTNTSGGAVAAGDVGYIDSAGEFKTTTTANLNASWAVVTVGGANSADIYVTRRGRVTVNYTGSDPAAGDYLVTSASAGDAQASTTMRPEIFAVCLAAGSGGQVEALLLCGRKSIPFAGSADVFFTTNTSVNNFVATINGAPSGASVVYTLTTGNEECIVPVSTSELAKLVLHNTTRGDSARISSVNTGTNTITLTANAPGTWQSGDTITTRSQTNTSTIDSSYFSDLEITATEIDTLTVGVTFQLVLRDTGAAGLAYMLHPFEANATAKRQNYQNQVANIVFRTVAAPVPIIQRRFCLAFNASGSGTGLVEVRAFGLIIAEP